ncbi:MAG TPA: type II secretion system minor pseudopilin GspK [Thiobacillaceae bacterium]|nr:type II secretion system minor pseudopilin GspK [Thiobacillaceae bacterium]HNU64070.1 type II secretion system minor pseudopilin GspK [Thiobacillaceae bacterium]
MTPARQHQTGAAVIVAMLVVALAAMTASSFMFRTQVEWRRMENLVDVGQARWALRGGQEWGASVLRDDAANSNVDHPDEAWATRLPPVETEGYRLWGWIEDQEGRFNLNNLVTDGAVDTDQQAMFTRLLKALRLPESLAASVVDWLDADHVPLGEDSAESPHYDGRLPPYRAANRTLISVNELRQVKGMDDKTLDRLRPFVTALPSHTGINVNTARAEVLAALVVGLDVDAAYAMVARRDHGYYRHAQDFQLALPQGLNAPADMVAVSSQYFLVHARIRRDRLVLGNQALYRRQGTSFPTLIWRMDI